MGITVCLAVGLSDGDLLGPIIGEAIGADDGDLLGIAVGEAIGADGCVVGFMALIGKVGGELGEDVSWNVEVGPTDGGEDVSLNVEVGPTDGFNVGNAVGEAEGCAKLFLDPGVGNA
jgi:hypothetical protein